jgi:hypothetical protein
MDWIHLAQDKGPLEGPYERSNEPSGSPNVGKILACLSNCWLHTKHSSPWS